MANDDNGDSDSDDDDGGGYRHFIQMFSHIMFMYRIAGCCQTIFPLSLSAPGVAEGRRRESDNEYWIYQWFRVHVYTRLDARINSKLEYAEPKRIQQERERGREGEREGIYMYV